MQPEECYRPPSHAALDTSSVTRLSLVRSAASALKFVTIRCRNTAGATVFTSSKSAIGRPSIAARAFAPNTRYCDARGPAPHSTNSRMNFGDSAATGRVIRASVTAERTSPFETGIRRTRR